MPAMDHSNKLYSNLSRGFFNVTLFNRKYLYAILPEDLQSSELNELEL